MTSSYTSATSKNWVIANWKMQPTTQAEVKDLVANLSQKLADNPDNLPNITLAPSFLHLSNVKEALKNSPFQLSAQNLCGQNASHGAFTGEISAKQLTDMGVTSVIIGHSERRQYFAETNEILSQKLECALSQGLSVIFCVGETLEQYESKKTQTVIAEQLMALQTFLTDEYADNIIIAYEPVWAIGTGKVPTVDEVTNVHQFIADTLAKNNPNFAKIPILYGGSVKADNAKDFAQSPVVSGVLVGGASLNADSFWQIIEAFSATN